MSADPKMTSPARADAADADPAKPSFGAAKPSFGAAKPSIGAAVEVDADRAVVDLSVEPQLLQPHGIVHGGVYCTLAEHAARLAAQQWLAGRARAVCTAATTQFLRAIGGGTVRATAEPVHRGRSQQLWRVLMTDQATGRLVATADIRFANLS